MDAEYSRGQRLYVKTNTHNLEGIFYSMNTRHNVMTLADVVVHPSEEKKEGFCHVHRSEVISVLVVDGVSGKLSPKKKQAAQSQSHDSSEPSEEEYGALDILIENHVVVENMGDIFRKAVEDINAERAVGFSIEGAMLGRYSRASLLSFATPSCTFLFDILILGDAAFDNGLRDILESEQILKVIHNCRIVSDYLYHKHRVTIRGVLDTQVMDLMVRHLSSGHFPLRVRNLPQCLRTYLNCPTYLVYTPEIPLESLRWNRRPLPMELLITAVKNSSFLLELLEEISEKIPRQHHRYVDVFLSVVRDTHDTERREYEANNAKVPLEVVPMCYQV